MMIFWSHGMPGGSEQKTFLNFKLQKKAVTPSSCTLCSAMMAPARRVPGVGLAWEKWSQRDIPGGGHSPPPSWREKPTQLFSTSSTILAACHDPGLVFVLRLTTDSPRKSNESHIWVRFQSKPQIAFVNNVYSAVVSASGWENKYLMGNKIFKTWIVGERGFASLHAVSHAELPSNMFSMRFLFKTHAKCFW